MQDIALPEWIIEGPSECVAGDTEICNLADGKIYKIADLARMNIAPIVETLMGPVQAGVPFKKGIDALYRVMSSNGKSFLATRNHLVLTMGGWKFVGSCEASESLLEYGEAHLLSSSERARPIRVQDALSCAGIALDYQENYLACCHPYDGQLQADQDNAQFSFPSQADARACIHADHNLDDPESLLAYSHPCQLLRRPSNDYSFPSDANEEMGRGVCHEKLCMLSHGAYSFLSCEQSHLGYVHHLPFGVIENRFSHMRSSCVPPVDKYTIFGSTLSSIEFEGMGDYYDLTVPGAGHYFANGFIHHNTGKTLACLWCLHRLCATTPNVQGAILRKVLADVYGTVLRTYSQRIISPADNVHPYGGEKPEWYDYPNGSRIWIGGMDKPGKVLSGERDWIYFNQAEEATLNDWETLTTRVTGRAGNIAAPFLCGDANPRGPSHWILQRERSGSLHLLHSHHVDNPALYTDDGLLTEQGIRTMAVLNKLTGMRRERLLLGKWAQAEGLVYEQFNRDVHINGRASQEFKMWLIGADEGYTNPAVLLLIGVDGDGRIHIEREFYETGRLQADVVNEAVTWARTVPITTVAVDSSAAGLIADMVNSGLPADSHKGHVLDGIHTIQSLLTVAGDGKPCMTVDPSCINTINEFESYAWKAGKDAPVDANNHALDALRYAVDWLIAPQVVRQVIYDPIRI